MKVITSSANEIFKKYASLVESKGIKKHSLCILSGKKLVAEFLIKPHLEIEAEMITGDMKPLSKNVIQLSRELFQELDVVGTHHNLLVLKTPFISLADLNKKPEGLELVVPLGDPNNLGAVLRSAEAFSVKRVILTREACNPFLPKVIKSSSGSSLKIPLFYGPELKEIPLQNSVGLDLDGDNILDFKWPKNIRLLVGEEGPGLASKKLEHKIYIPTQGVESLNAVVATSISLFHYKSQNR